MDNTEPTDLDAYRAILTRAGIAWHEDVSTQGFPYTSLTVESNHDIASGVANQPHPGGYPGFSSEHVFDPAGALWAVWAWE